MQEKPFVLLPIDNTKIELGQQVFKKKCESCHKMEFKSIGPDISDIVHVKGEKITSKKLNGLDKNCYDKKISKEDARNILEYLRQYEVWLHEINAINKYQKQENQ